MLRIGFRILTLYHHTLKHNAIQLEHYRPVRTPVNVLSEIYSSKWTVKNLFRYCMYDYVRKFKLLPVPVYHNLLFGACFKYL